MINETIRVERNDGGTAVVLLGAAYDDGNGGAIVTVVIHPGIVGDYRENNPEMAPTAAALDLAMYTLLQDPERAKRALEYLVGRDPTGARFLLMLASVGAPLDLFSAIDQADKPRA